HLNFIIISGILFLVIFIIDIKKLKIYQALLFIFSASLPLLIVGWWFWVHYPESVKELWFVLNIKNSGWGSYKKGFLGAGLLLLLTEASMISCKVGLFHCWQTLIQRIFVSIFWMPLLVSTISAIIILVKNKREFFKINKINVLMTSLFIGVMIMEILDKNAYFWYYIITSVFVVFFLSLLITFRSPITVDSHMQSIKLSTIIIIFLCVIVSTNLLLQRIRYTIYRNQYILAPNIYQDVSKHLRSGDTLFLWFGQIGTFMELMDAQYKRDSDISVYYIFPQTYLFEKADKMKTFLRKKIEEVQPEKMVWAAAKYRVEGASEGLTFFPNKMEFRYFVPYGVGKLWLKFSVKEIIYEDWNTVFFRPSKVEMLTQ
ncbi:MAG: hypothetical protein HQK93_05125, partial [Nitrospirae bacterium]|nr:hypothetical protein [Nitrospirota bacterium]